MSTILHERPPRPDVLAHVSENLRRFRRDAGLSQEALAKASGISRRMIASLEGGDTNISLTSLDRLAEPLGVSFGQMVSDPNSTTTATGAKRIEAVAWRGQDADSVAVLLGSVPARQDAQLWSWSLSPGDRYDGEPDPVGWHEMIAVVEGSLRIELAEGPITVEAGDFAVYSSAQTFAYVNDGATITRFIRNVVA